ncbi:MAG: NADH-quinone oxidoreductase subunit M [Desulfocapsaceae bacterium]|nr:NADH-quinone oxidoreductase subunit M [Desulfocapsaceae bacterium]
MISFPLLSAIVFWPLAGGLFVLAFWRYPQVGHRIALGAASVELLLVVSLLLLDLHPQGADGWLMIEDLPWIAQYGVRYSLGLDGISLILLCLTALLGVIAILASWEQISQRPGVFYFMLLFTQSAVMGVFLATDLFLFYLFWEMQLIPMLFLVGIWGHEKRIYAALKFFLFNIAGGLLMLAALIGLYLLHGRQTGDYSFALSQLMQTRPAPVLEMWLYGAFLLAFAIKIPIFPLHGWLPDAHTEAPTAGSIILAGLLLKTGAYALLRIAIPLFPGAAHRLMPLLLILGLVGIVYASLVALGQKDMKRLVAYSSIGHMGLIVLGLAVWDSLTLSGAVLQMVNHGITTAALFIMVGMLDERFHTRTLADFGGLWKSMPIFSAFFLLFAMASLGMPGLNNFVSEFLILVGVFRAHPVIGSLAFTTIVLTLIYVLKLVQDTLFGPEKQQHCRDLSFREWIILLTLALAVIANGLYPQPILTLVHGPVQHLIDQAGIITLPEAGSMMAK